MNISENFVNQEFDSQNDFYYQKYLKYKKKYLDLKGGFCLTDKCYIEEVIKGVEEAKKCGTKVTLSYTSKFKYDSGTHVQDKVLLDKVEIIKVENDKDKLKITYKGNDNNPKELKIIKFNPGTTIDTSKKYNVEITFPSYKDIVEEKDKCKNNTIIKHIKIEKPFIAYAINNIVDEHGNFENTFPKIISQQSKTSNQSPKKR